MSFQDYLKNREQAFQSVTEKLKNDTFQKNDKDDRLWKPTMGQDGTGYAVVRFLPGLDVSKAPWVKLYNHGFQGPTGKWYIENSLTTFGQQDPVSEYNSKLWNSGVEADKEKARKQKRRTNYYANVLVLKDPADPSSEGQVKLYRFGQKIFDMIMGAMQPEFADDEPINPFDMIEGANFRIKLRTVGGYWNYDASSFEKAGPLTEDDEKLEAIFNAQHDVHELVAPENFKSYEELSRHLEVVLETEQQSPAVQETQYKATEEEVVNEFADAFSEEAETSSGSTDDDDDLEDYFKNLAAD